MNIELGYDTRIQTVTVPEDRLLAVLEPSAFPPTAGIEEDLIRAALVAPIGAPPLREVVNAGEKIVLVTSDISRPMPTWKVMPAVLDELYAAGARPEDITLVFARGVHRAHKRAPRHLKDPAPLFFDHRLQL